MCKESLSRIVYRIFSKIMLFIPFSMLMRSNLSQKFIASIILRMHSESSLFYFYFRFLTLIFFFFFSLSWKVLVVTSLGDIDIELWCKECPLACRNFIQLCLEGFYDGLSFHRLIKGSQINDRLRSLIIAVTVLYNFCRY